MGGNDKNCVGNDKKVGKYTEARSGTEGAAARLFLWVLGFRYYLLFGAWSLCFVLLYPQRADWYFFLRSGIIYL